VVAAGELNRDAHRRCLGEKARQIGDRAGFHRPRSSCGLLRQAILTLSPRLHSLHPVKDCRCNCHSNRVSHSAGKGKRSGGTCYFLPTSAVGLPLFPVRKSVGEPEHAVTQETEARPGPQCGTEGLVLRG
jgi:hypothetical protein